MPQFVVISGKKQSGKTTAAHYIERRTHLGKIVSFADPIKDFCQDVLGFTQKQITGTDKEKNSPTSIMWDNMPKEIQTRYCKPSSIQLHVGDYSKTGPMTAREVMQIFGTDIMRHFFDYDIWAKAPFKKNWGTTDVVIIDDCRFPNEADAALEHDAILIRLNRNPLHDTHVSEIAMDNYDLSNYTWVVHNKDFTLDQLDLAVGRFLYSKGYSK